jgi:NDP-sugar pyrophosphorylase family protein
MKAIILAAGRGNRLQEITDPINKCMLDFNGRPLIQYSIESARLSGVKEIIIVVGYRAEDIINAFGISYEGIRIRYVIQEQLAGLVSAIEQCRSAVEGDHFILFLADEILIDPKPMEMITVFKEEDLFAVCGVTPVEDVNHIRKTYSVIYNESTNKIYRLIEKPRKPINNIMGTGNCVFKNAIFDYIPYTPINQSRHEKELPDLIQCAIDDGNPVKLFLIGAKYVNINTPEDIIIADKNLGIGEHH